MSSWLDKADSNCNVENDSQETKGEICLGGKKRIQFQYSKTSSCALEMLYTDDL